MSHVTSLPNFVCSHSRYKEAAVACFVIVEKNQVWLHCSHLVCAVAPKQLKLDILDLKEIFSMIEVMFSFVSPHCFYICGGAFMLIFAFHPSSWLFLLSTV